jgi:hypothetical protein
LVGNGIRMQWQKNAIGTLQRMYTSLSHKLGIITFSNIQTSFPRVQPQLQCQQLLQKLGSTQNKIFHRPANLPLSHFDQRQSTLSSTASQFNHKSAIEEADLFKEVSINECFQRSTGNVTDICSAWVKD